jgi:hypothetical protein
MVWDFNASVWMIELQGKQGIPMQESANFSWASDTRVGFLILFPS